MIVTQDIAAQTDVQMTQYWAVPTYYNPASTGETDNLRIRGGAKLQWLGIKNAPMGFLALADAPLKIGKQKIGVGVAAMQESLGLFSNLQLGIQGSVKFKALKGEFSVGLQGAYFNQKFKGTKVDIPDGDDYHESGDEAIPNEDLSGNAFDFSAGILYTHKYFHFGIAGQHILQPTVKMNVEGTESTDTHDFETELGRMVYFIGGGNIPIKNTLFELQPSFLVKTDFSNFTAEIDFRATYNKFLTFGAGYRWKDAVSVMVGATYKNFFLGYAFDYPLSAIAKASSGSHEIVAGYQLKLDFSQKNKNKHRSIRLM
ncbi:MAG: type IX secretion system membrane protein PorP/SprF [Prevotella sp.]|nr:type IX secretion system membrane protein PorP/SprF [Bacteroides sp.]MCM1366449.1 type IX secretion system membrane protein PorP/SprF [Prevotella sp.]MCM1437071.1 type IX secretion system membrane protein PorP/SprF [Prevotella sp.]